MVTKKKATKKTNTARTKNTRTTLTVKKEVSKTPLLDPVLTPPANAETAPPVESFQVEKSPAPAMEVQKQVLPCLVTGRNRPQGYTCLDELEEAVSHPERFTEYQLGEIHSENNLCPNCRKNYAA